MQKFGAHPANSVEKHVARMAMDVECVEWMYGGRSKVTQVLRCLTKMLM